MTLAPPSSPLWLLHAQVLDSTPPQYPAGDGVKACIHPPNDKLLLFTNVKTNPIFKLSGATDNCQQTITKSSFVSCRPSGGYKKNAPLCTYDAKTDTLAVPAHKGTAKGDNVFVVEWLLQDACGNVRTARPSVAVLDDGKRLPTGCGGKFYTATVKPPK